MLFIILLLEGFITISVEILTIRQLLPFFGGSIIITSIIIGMFLLFLALGYWRGGLYQRDFFQQLSRNFVFTLAWVGIGLSYTAVAVFYYVLVYKVHCSFLMSLFLYLVIILAPIVYWLGQTIPLTTNLFNQQYRVSRISGKALFLSTIGSFLGALITSLLFFQYFGVAWAVVINCGLLFLLIMCMRKETKLTSLQVVWLVGGLIFIFIINIKAENAQFKHTNNYANYQIERLNDFSKILQINHSYSSLLTIDKKGFPYIESVRDILFNQLNLQQKQILVIGAGGFSLTADGTHDNAVTYVDIDPDIKRIAEDYFLDHPIQGLFIHQDARSYLKQTNTRFDVIFSDAYSNQATVPASLLTYEYFQALQEHLNSDGFMILNLIANPFFDDDYSKKVFNTIHAVFPYCAVLPLAWRDSSVNIIFICPKKGSKPVIYRDDLNTVTMDFFKAAPK